MDPILGGALISGGIGLATNLWNTITQRKTNETAYNQSKQYLDQQRQWALQDTESNNKYNSPAQQMQRLREAGLNPHLVYGKGADNTGAMVRSVQGTPPTPIAPKLDTSAIGSSIGQYYTIKQQQAQTDNINAQTKLAEKESLLKDMNIAGVGINNAKNEFELDQARQLKDSVIKKAQADAEYAQDNTLRAGAAFNTSQIEASKRIQQIIENTKHTKAQRELQQLELNLKRLGIEKNDPIWVRFGAQGVQNILRKYGIKNPLDNQK